MAATVNRVSSVCDSLQQTQLY